MLGLVRTKLQAGDGEEKNPCRQKNRSICDSSLVCLNVKVSLCSILSGNLGQPITGAGAAIKTVGI